MKKYKSVLVESSITINNVDSAILAIAEGVKFIFNKFKSNPHLMITEISIGIVDGLEGSDDKFILKVIVGVYKDIKSRLSF